MNSAAIRPAFSFQLQFLVIPVLLMIGASSAASGQILDETLSGSGSFQSNAGRPGFDNFGWFETGTVSGFSTNSFGEGVFGASVDGSSSGSSGLFRTIGDQSFSTVVEFSNPVLSSGGLSNVQINVADRINSNTPADLVAIFVNRNGSEYRAWFSSYVNEESNYHNIVSLGNSLDRVTLRLDYVEDLVNGGGIFNAYYDVDESGSFTHLGSIDGTVYSTEATSNRTAFIGNVGDFGHAGSVEIDRFTINAVPEPSTLALFPIAIMGFASRIRRRRS